MLAYFFFVCERIFPKLYKQQRRLQKQLIISVRRAQRCAVMRTKHNRKRWQMASAQQRLHKTTYTYSSTNTQNFIHCAVASPRHTKQKTADVDDYMIVRTRMCVCVLVCIMEGILLLHGWRDKNDDGGCAHETAKWRWSLVRARPKHICPIIMDRFHCVRDYEPLVCVQQ